MIPETSPHYTYELKAMNACGDRYKGTIVASDTSSDPLKIAYRKYSKTAATRPSAIQLNLVFTHGNGMNKAVWHTQIDNLYTWLSEQYTNSLAQLNTVVAIDFFNHGDSAELNQGRLGDDCDWRDTSRDVIKLVTEDEASAFQTKHKSMTILIGHSMGGFVSMYASYLGGSKLFDSCVAINPVAYTSADLQSTLKRFNFWREKFLKTDFTISEPENWYNEVVTYLRKKSFYMKLDDTVLKNMLEDDIPKETAKNKQNSKVALKSTVEAQMACYLSMHRVTLTSSNKYREIKVPVYRILGDRDTSDNISREFLSDALKNQIHNILVPGGKHLFNCEEPLLASHLFLGIIQERILLHSKQLEVDAAKQQRKASL